MIDELDLRPDSTVEEAEYVRLLGYPRGHVLTDRARELAGWGRQWFADHGRPWVYLREASLDYAGDVLRIDGCEFQSRQLREHLSRAGATRVVLVAACAGGNCEDQARQLWEAAKPDEYFFLEMFGSAVVERMVATASGRICELADRDGLMAVPHYSPGYSGWDVSDQARLFELITRGAQRAFPEPIEVMASGMLRPKKALLGVFGLAPKSAAGRDALRASPCANCALASCRFRRASYRHAPAPAVAAAPAQPAGRYTVNARALAKWARERVRLERDGDGTLRATFRYDGTTCSNMGRPLAFDYTVTLGDEGEGYPIRSSECRPAPGDEGYEHMCAYQRDAGSLMRAIASEQPLLGRPLDEVLTWTRDSAPAGCHCEAVSRAHKWGLALEAIHFALGIRRKGTTEFHESEPTAHHALPTTPTNSS
ncbi:MAG: hypothetical protein HZA93_04100 [Verrucomicrobia bacterium]|nr:hypothetical protein [Verrucomicrobiota bacterium]